VHSVVSNGGELSTAQLAVGARAAGLDFLATTEHNTSATHGAWNPHLDDDLLVILGQEVTTQSGHWLALGIAPGEVIDWRYSLEDHLLERHLDGVHRCGGLGVAAHPHAPYPTGTLIYPYQAFDVIEVWNGQWSSDLPWQADNEAALVDWDRLLVADVGRGAWVPAMGNSDTHAAHQIGLPHTVVRADELSSDAILDGIRAGRSWIAAASGIELSFTVATGPQLAEIGDQLTCGAQPAVARVEVAGVPSGIVTFHTDHGKRYRAALPRTGSASAGWHTTAAESRFVRVEVRNRTGAMAALTNPILLA
jgi:hypothetical protein